MVSIHFGMKNMIYEWIWKVDNRQTIFSFISNQFNLAFHRLLYIYPIVTDSYHFFQIKIRFLLSRFYRVFESASKTADVSSFPQTVSRVGNDRRIGENHEQDFPGLAGPFLCVRTLYPNYPFPTSRTRHSTLTYTLSPQRTPFYHTQSESVSSDVLEPIRLEYTVAQELFAVLDREHNQAGPQQIHQTWVLSLHGGRRLSRTIFQIRSAIPIELRGAWKNTANVSWRERSVYYRRQNTVAFIFQFLSIIPLF